ncbi:type II secretion system secretin GspD [Salinicola corii]|nr:type II secretion system secretin GspD [Salinicola corii]
MMLRMVLGTLLLFTWSLFAWLPTASGQPWPPEGNVEAPRYEVDFDDVSLAEFIHSIGRITGKSFVIDPRVRGNISLNSQRALTADELYRVFQNELQVNGYATIPLSDGSVRVVPDQVARTQPVPLGGDDAGQVIATQVIETQHLNATTLAEILKPLVDTRVGLVTAYPDSRLLVVTDWRDNLERLTRLAQRLDQSRESEAQMIPLHNASAKDLAETLDGVMQQEGSQTRVIAAPSDDALVVFGPGRERERLKRLVASLDTQTSQQTNTRVIYLNHSSAEAVVNVLNNLRSGNSVGGLSSSLDSANPGTALAGSDTSAADTSSASGTGSSSASGTMSSLDNGKNVSFAVYPDTNAIVLSGPSNQLDKYQRIIERLDIRRAQVAVEAIIAEITESRARQIGVQWLFADTSGSGSIPVGSVNFPTSSNPGIAEIAAAAASDDTSALGSLLGSMGGITTGVGRLSDSGISFAVLLNALRSDTDTNLLSTPSLMTLDNAEAYILVGQEVPFVTGSTTVDNSNPYQTIQREDVGVKLHIRPTISADNTIRMQITQEVSSIANNVDASDVVTNKREIETTVVTQDGGIIVLGGLISRQNSNAQQRVPLLGDIPLIGNLFRYSSNESEKQNLMVFIRARVIRDAQTMDAATAEKYRYMRAQQLLHDLDAEQRLPELETANASISSAPDSSTAEGQRPATDWQTLYPSARERLGTLTP